MQYNLEPIDGRKSFYGKAVVYETDGVIYLRSYDTVVAELDVASNKVKVNGRYSMTTARHINAFLQQYGFNKMTKNEMNNYTL